jgi:2-haloacid dehalogenase
MSSYVIGFDVYGTLVDPQQMQEYLRPFAGDRAAKLAQLWREKQIEYAFRKALMKRYEDFGVCTLQALVFALHAFDISLSHQEQERVLDGYLNLRAFPDVQGGLKELRAQGHRLFAFSNGVRATVRKLLDRAGIIGEFEDVISVDDVKSFKPDPTVYSHLVRKADQPVIETWLVSSNPWDVIGAKSAGLRAAWIRRSGDQLFDPWGVDPDTIAKDLVDLGQQFSWKLKT